MGNVSYRTVPILDRKRPKTKLPDELDIFVKMFERHIGASSIEVNEPDDEGLWVIDVTHGTKEIVVTFQCGYYTVGLLSENEMKIYTSTNGALVRTFYLCGRPHNPAHSAFFMQSSADPNDFEAGIPQTLSRYVE
jgi:hypothetical protein